MEQTQETCVGAAPAVGRGQRGFGWPQHQEGTETKEDQRRRAGRGSPGEPGGQAGLAVHTHVFAHRRGTAASRTGQKAWGVLLP